MRLNIFKTSKAFEAACKMPTGLKHQPKPEFAYADSQIVQWLIAQPEIQKHLFEKMKESEAIVFDPATRTWKGRDS